MNLNMRAAAILVWLPEGENPGLDSFSPQMVFSPPSPNPEAWWCLEDVIHYVNGADRGDHKKVPWIKTGDAILGPDQISRAYGALRAARNFDVAGDTNVIRNFGAPKSRNFASQISGDSVPRSRFRT
jgi:hypothetical protein